MKNYVIALDQGTTSSRCIIFDKQQNIVSSAQKELTQIYPQPGFVEHDAMEVFSSQYGVMVEAIKRSEIDPSEIAAIGISNQRETTVLWEKASGKPVHNAIVWQCRRSAKICEDLKTRGLEETVKKSTGLVIDAYFSATKIKWLLDNLEGLRERCENGEILFGTIDSWLVWKMTEGKSHVTDVTNASRTMLFNIEKQEWDAELLSEFGIPSCMLPEVKSSSEHFGFVKLLGEKIPITGLAGDQQAALFGQCCFESGEAKNTYGTGCFLLMNTGNRRYTSKSGLITTIAIGLNGKIQYALEGSVFIGGAVIQWLRDEMRIVQSAKESEEMALKVKDCGGVVFVPAFTGLGAPHWDMSSRGAVFGLTRGTKPEHIVRAALESVAFQTSDIILAIEADTGINLKHLKVDGGASDNDFLMQFQADILNKNVVRPKIKESTALGAAMLAGLAVGFWKDLDEVKSYSSGEKEFSPQMNVSQANIHLKHWNDAVSRTKNWPV